MSNLPEQNNSSIPRITWGQIWKNFLIVINFERGLFFTIKGLIIAPKNTIDNYLYKTRTQYVNPLRFLVFTTAIFTLLSYYMYQSGNYVTSVEFGEGVIAGMNHSKNTNDPAKIDDATKSITAQDTISDKKKKKINSVLDNVSSSMDKFTFLMIPIISAFTFLFFRKTGYNYVENLVINSFLTSVLNVFGIIMLIPIILYTTIGTIVLPVVSIGFNYYFFVKVYTVHNFWEHIKVIFSIIFSYTFLIFFMVLYMYFLMKS